MSKVYFCSDQHFGHKAILKYRPQFKTVEEHDQIFIDNFNKVVQKRDTVFFLGDVAFTEEGLETLSKFKHCHKKILYLGNHDTLPVEKYLKYFDEVHALRSYKNFWISHCPLHPGEMRNRKGNIHGHLHGSVLEGGSEKYFDVSPENHNYELVDFQDIKDYFESQESNNS